MKKYIFLSLIILTIFVSGCALITKEPKEEIKQENPWKELLDTSTWKTYENTEYGFSFMYPEQIEFTVDSTLKDSYVQRLSFFLDDELFFELLTYNYNEAPKENEIVYSDTITKEYMDKRYNYVQKNKGELLDVNGIYIDKYLSFLDGYFYKSEFFIDKNYIIIQWFLDMGSDYDASKEYIEDEKGHSVINREYITTVIENIESEKVDSYILDQIQIYNQMLNSLKNI